MEPWHHMDSSLLTKQPRGHQHPPFAYTENTFYNCVFSLTNKKCHHQSVLGAWRCVGEGFLSFWRMTQIALTAAGGNPRMLLPSCSSMLLILFSEGNRIFGGLSVKGAEKGEKRQFEYRPTDDTGRLNMSECHDVFRS